MLSKVLSALRHCWHNFTPQWAKSLLIPLVNVTYKNIQTRLNQKNLAQKYSILETHTPKPGPLIVSGFFGEALGIGRAAHCTVKALENAEYAPVQHPIRELLLWPKRSSVDLPGDEEGGVYILHCNAPEAENILPVLTVDSLKHKYRIGYWAYELPKAPKSWIELTKFFHEIWVPSNFVKDSLEGAYCPVRVVPHDVTSTLPTVRENRTALRLPESKFLILAAGDLRSSSYRKNLFGAIDTYITAFPTPSDEVSLVLKFSFKNADNRSAKLLEEKTHARPDIHLITDHLSYEEMLTLIKSSDLLLSTHRSEGFGLILAEALALKVPVLATGWSGNMDFMQNMEPAHIPYTLTAVDDPSGVYARQREQLWAEPNIEIAAQQLRTLYDQKELYRDLAQTGQKNVRALSEKWLMDDLLPNELIDKIK